MEVDELPPDTAAKELREETGYVGKRTELHGPLLPNSAFNTARFHVAVIWDCTP